MSEYRFRELDQAWGRSEDRKAELRAARQSPREQFKRVIVSYHQMTGKWLTFEYFPQDENPDDQ